MYTQRLYFQAYVPILQRFRQVNGLVCWFQNCWISVDYTDGCESCRNMAPLEKKKSGHGQIKVPAYHRHSQEKNPEFMTPWGLVPKHKTIHWVFSKHFCFLSNNSVQLAALGIPQFPFYPVTLQPPTTYNYIWFLKQHDTVTKGKSILHAMKIIRIYTQCQIMCHFTIKKKRATGVMTALT